MFKKILMASLAVGALALNAPVATAAEATGQCGFDSVQQDSTTGQNYEGVAYGFASDTDGDPVTIRCYITVNTVPAPAGSTPIGSGPAGVAATSGVVSFEATENDDVKLCTEVNGALQGCADSTNTQVPPQEVIDLIADATAGLDPLICAVLQASMLMPVVNSVVPGTFDLDDCDIYVNGGRFIDFVPYED